MNKLAFALFSLLGGSVAFAIAAPGCADVCDDLSARCGQCGDADYAAACRAVVNRNNQDLCSAELATFELFCIEEPAVGGGGGVPAGPCRAGQSLCQGQCVDLNATPAFCGSCLLACAEGELCAAAACVTACPPELPIECNGGCINPQNNPLHCGGCGIPCDEGEVCSQGLCAAGCDPMSSTPTACNGSCVDLMSDPLHCGMCGNACAGGSCENGACTSGCTGGKRECDGQCVDTLTDPMNCGSCGNACGGGSPLCAQGACVESCPSPLVQCPGTNGCFDTASDAEHCGAACTDCTADPNGNTKCAMGTCIGSCPPGTSDCGGSCVDTMTALNHCGSCGNSCNDNSICTSDACNMGMCDNQSSVIACNDGDSCTKDECDPVTGCSNTAYTHAEIISLCGTVQGWGTSANDPCIFCTPDGPLCDRSLACTIGGTGGGPQCTPLAPGCVP